MGWAFISSAWREVATRPKENTLVERVGEGVPYLDRDWNLFGEVSMIVRSENDYETGVSVKKTSGDKKNTIRRRTELRMNITF